MDTIQVNLDQEKPEQHLIIKDHTVVKEMFRIHLKNYFLSLITLGIYRFWAKTNMRRYLWSHVEFQGSRFEYTGTAKELFLGFVIIFFLVLLPITFFPDVYLYFFPETTMGEIGIIGGLQGLIIILLIPAALFRARRYRLTRTRWRAIYGGQSGSAFKFSILTWLYSYLLTPLSLFLFSPWASRNLMQYKLDHTWLGSLQPEFKAPVGQIFKKFIWAMFLSIITVALTAIFIIWLTAMITKSSGVSTAQEMFAALSFYWMILFYIPFLFLLAINNWYRAVETMYFLECTSISNIRFITSKKALLFAWVSVKSMMIVLLTLGLGTPWTYKMYLQFFEQNFAYVGELDVEAMAQHTLEKPTVGEGLADAIDVGAI
ncbi:MAG: YjgN family protein [Alphaproteobacteria bacterium]|nr:YjgN family protein [Rhodospirillales bacterium]MCW9044898.1 YjgN family protein [Alphaproteobacteria bacterium]